MVEEVLDILINEIQKILLVSWDKIFLNVICFNIKALEAFFKLNRLW